MVLMWSSLKCQRNARRRGKVEAGVAGEVQVIHLSIKASTDYWKVF